MRRKQKPEEILRQQKDARAKKLLFLLVPLLVVLLAVIGPGALKQLRGSQTAAPPAATETGAASTAGPSAVPGVTDTTPPAATGPAAPAVTSPEAALAVQGSLPPTDVPPPAGEDDLVTFSRFEARDPFVQLVADTSAESTDASTSTAGASASTVDASVQTTTAATTTTTTTSDGTSGGTDTTGSTSGGDATTTQVTISVNGKATVVNVGETFPASDPAFKLVAIEGNIAKIGLASGSFSGGMQTLDLEVGQTVTLISQPDGTRFQLKLMKVG